MNQPLIPVDWAQATPAWMTAALAASTNGAEVATVELLLRDDGTNRRARFGLTYSSGSGPQTVFVKAGDPAHAALNAKTGGALNEPRLFAADAALPIDHPAVHCSRFDEETLDFVLVMEDVTARGGDPRDSTRPYTVDQAAAGVRALARFHAATAGHRFDTGALGWVGPLECWRGMDIGVDMGLERIGGSSIPTEVVELAGAGLDHAWRGFVASMADGIQSLLHGDPHIGNTYALPGDDVGFLDWQVIRRGHPSLDLGYFLQGAVTEADRRRSERDLVAEYVDALALPDGEQPTFDDVWVRYRASAAHGALIWLATSASDWQRFEVSLPLAQRYSTAFVELDAVSAVASLVDR